MPAEVDARDSPSQKAELVQKLVLTNFLLFVNFEESGSNKLLRLFIGLLIAVFGLTVQLSAQPPRPVGCLRHAHVLRSTKPAIR